MHQIPAALCLSAVLTVTAGAAMATQLPNPSPAFVSEHQNDLRADTRPAAPFAIAYSDEAAETLGVHDGKWAFLDTGRPARAYMPSLKGGVERDGLKLRLMWNLGR
jgi:hypothetical protein